MVKVSLNDIEGNRKTYDSLIMAKRLKKLRAEQQMTQPILAKLIGVTNGTIGHWEVGSRTPSIETMFCLAQVFKVSVDYLMGFTDFRKDEDAVDYLFEKLAESGLLRSDNTIDKKTVNKIISYISAIKMIQKD